MTLKIFPALLVLFLNSDDYNIREAAQVTIEKIQDNYALYYFTGTLEVRRRLERVAERYYKIENLPHFTKLKNTEYYDDDLYIRLEDEVKRDFDGNMELGYKLATEYYVKELIIRHGREDIAIALKGIE